MQIRRASRSMTYAKVLITGPSGAGKSMGALLLAKGMINKMPYLGMNSKRIGYIGSEGDRDELYALEVGETYDPKRPKFDYDIISLEENEKNRDGYVAALQAFLKAGYKVIIIDSLTHLWKWTEDRVAQEKAAGANKNGLDLWGKWKKENRKLLDMILNSEAHIICTVRGKDQYDISKDENGKTQITKLGVGSQQDKDIEYEFMVSILIDQQTHMATATKDNTYIFDDGSVNNKFRKLSERDGELIMDWALNNQGASLEECRDLRTKITEICTSKGGQKNKPLMSKFNELFKAGFKNCNDKGKLEEAIMELSKIPAYSEQEKQPEETPAETPAEASEEENKEEETVNE